MSNKREIAKIAKEVKLIKASLEGLTKTASEIKEFVSGDWSTWNSAKPWSLRSHGEDHEPFIAEMSNLEIPYLLEDEDGNALWDATIIGDSKGVIINLYYSKSNKEGPVFSKEKRNWDPEENYAEMEDAMRNLRSGRIPRKYYEL